MDDDHIPVDDIISTNDASEMLGISIQGVINAINRGRIKGIKVGRGKGGSWIVSKSSVLAYKASRSSRGRKSDKD